MIHTYISSKGVKLAAPIIVIIIIQQGGEGGSAKINLALNFDHQIHACNNNDAIQ